MHVRIVPEDLGVHYVLRGGSERVEVEEAVSAMVVWGESHTQYTVHQIEAFP